MGLKEIVNLYANMTLLEKEGPVLRLHDGVLKKISRVKGRVEIDCANHNIFTFRLKSTDDQIQVQVGGPWTFDGALIALEEPFGNEDIDNMSFNRMEFCVQIHRVPLLCMTKEIRQLLGNMIGLVKEVDVGLSMVCAGEFLRIRILIDITKPLRRCLRVNVLKGREETVMLLHYERLPNHYYRCGLLGHPTRECAKDPVLDGERMEVLSFGAWLRAMVPKKKWSRRGGSWAPSESDKQGGNWKQRANPSSEGWWRSPLIRGSGTAHAVLKGDAARVKWLTNVDATDINDKINEFQCQ
ncbi:hypothetical protein LWI28_027168 [Acer negundo]|uniref:Zinc knuckle CX2CX4HX4C domain-containing protein n=1 Tax=Acer negundo TaxID=4023 RepID=A0AAD5ISJ0_ACENE|nr:hypothetical protein LWI28_027168 [Acer negundo]